VLYNAARYPTNAQIYLEQFFYGPASIGQPTAVTNFSHYGIAVKGIDELLEEARYHANADEQIKLWKEAQRRMARDVPAIPLFSLGYVLVRSQDVDLGFKQGDMPFYRFTEATRLR
jgi:peptide/nickel transport system substrate-binding protein